MGDEEEQRLAQQVYLVIRADVDKDGKNSNSQVLGVFFTGERPQPAQAAQCSAAVILQRDEGAASR